MAGVDIVHVPYRGSAPALADLIGGQVQLTFPAVPSAIEYIRAGNVREALTLEADKSELSRRYMVAVENLKAAQKYLTQVSPELLATLRRHHDTFRAMLQINLTVLATAHAVSEGIVRGVNTEIQRRNIPNTYTAAGQRATPGPRHITPLAVSRSL